ncbi:hypothetical protein B0H14DRAFT_1327072 [Mycena olivaceomarginata]|nr:hypothetical protein B0H14DRAFT_1327072 [Mycena olivaceomarginata]
MLSIQLGTLHGWLRALQEASPAWPTAAFGGSAGTEGEQNSGDMVVLEGGRLDGLDARVRALEGAVATSSASASIVSALPWLPTPDPSPSIPAYAPSFSLSSSPPPPSTAATEAMRAPRRRGREHPSGPARRPRGAAGGVGCLPRRGGGVPASGASLCASSASYGGSGWECVCGRERRQASEAKA